MSDPTPIHTSEVGDELWAAFQALVDERMNEADAAALAELLAASPEARRQYMAFMAMHARLIRLNRVQAGSFDASVFRGEPSTSRPQALRFNRIARHVLMVAAMLVLSAGLISIYLLTSHEATPESQVSPADSSPVATLINSTESVLVGGDPTEFGSEYGTGMYAIDDGMAEFLLMSRVTATMHGKARMQVFSPLSVHMTLGQADFSVPQGVTGFTVHLPDQSRIVDLGTRFRVQVDEAGRCQLRVTEGRVEWIPADSAGEPVILRAGQDAQITHGSLSLNELPKFVESFEQPAISGRTQMEPLNWVGSTEGYRSAERGLVHVDSSMFTTPFGRQAAYVAFHTNSGLTTAEGAIGLLAADVTYTVSFHVANFNDDADGDRYLVQLLAFEPGEPRQDVRASGEFGAGVMLAHREGRVTSSDMSQRDSFSFTPKAGDPNLGKDLAIRIVSQESNEVLFDNIELTAQLVDPSGAAGTVNTTTNRASEPADRLRGRRSADGPPSEN